MVEPGGGDDGDAGSQYSATLRLHVVSPLDASNGVVTPATSQQQRSLRWLQTSQTKRQLIAFVALAASDGHFEPQVVAESSFAIDALSVATHSTICWLYSAWLF